LVVADIGYFMSHRLAFALALKNAGFRLVVATTFSSPVESQKLSAYGFEVFDLRLRAKGVAFLGNLKLVWRLWRGFIKLRPDYVHVVSVRMVLLGLIAFRFSRAKQFIGLLAGMGYLFTSRSRLTRFLKSITFSLLRLLCLSSKVRLIVQNDDDYNTLANRLIEKSRLFLIKGSGVSLSDYAYLPEPKALPVVVSCISRMLKDKGIVELCEAARILYQKGRSDIHIQLVGDIHEVNPNSLSRQALLNFCEELPNLFWLGRRNDVAHIYSNSHIAVLPSYREGLPKTLLEAAACGRAIVSTDVPGCREICHDGENGYLVPSKNSVALAAAIESLADGSEIRQKFGRASRHMVEALFSDEIVIAQIMRLYA